jgi:hypothetical protein
LLVRIFLTFITFNLLSLIMNRNKRFFGVMIISIRLSLNSRWENWRNLVINLLIAFFFRLLFLRFLIFWKLIIHLLIIWCIRWGLLKFIKSSLLLFFFNLRTSLVLINIFLFRFTSSYWRRVVLIRLLLIGNIILIFHLINLKFFI